MTELFSRVDVGDMALDDRCRLNAFDRVAQRIAVCEPSAAPTRGRRTVSPRACRGQCVRNEEDVPGLMITPAAALLACIHSTCADQRHETV